MQTTEGSEGCKTSSWASISSGSRVHHFCVGVEDFSIDAALEKLKSDFPESNPTIYRGEELYFCDPDGILGQVSRIDYGGQRKIR